jgi:hypothetical protein
MGYTTKEIAQACVTYIVSMCNSHHKDRLDVLEHVVDLVSKDISLLKHSDPARNR